jgi:hypothetical protein
MQSYLRRYTRVRARVISFQYRGYAVNSLAKTLVDLEVTCTQTVLGTSDLQSKTFCLTKLYFGNSENGPIGLGTSKLTKLGVIK